MNCEVEACNSNINLKVWIPKWLQIAVIIFWVWIFINHLLKDNLKKFLKKNGLKNKNKIIDAIFNEEKGLLSQPNTPMYNYYSEKFKLNFPEFGKTQYCARYLKKGSVALH